MSDRCRSCNTEVIFVPSASTGKPMILDAKPEKRVFVCEVRGLPEGAALAQGGRAEGHRKLHPIVEACYSDLCTTYWGELAEVLTVYVDHHATCPDARNWKGHTRSDPPAEVRT